MLPDAVSGRRLAEEISPICNLPPKASVVLELWYSFRLLLEAGHFARLQSGNAPLGLLGVLQLGRLMSALPYLESLDGGLAQPRTNTSKVFRKTRTCGALPRAGGLRGDSAERIGAYCARHRDRRVQPGSFRHRDRNGGWRS